MTCLDTKFFHTPWLCLPSFKWIPLFAPPIVALEQADLLFLLGIWVWANLPTVRFQSRTTAIHLDILCGSLPSGPRPAEQIRVESFHALMICCRWQADPRYPVRVFHLLLFYRAECPLHDDDVVICFLLMDFVFSVFLLSFNGHLFTRYSGLIGFIHGFLLMHSL